jgi:ribosomal protein S18 acetylase RimI-like enzyme
MAVGQIGSDVQRRAFYIILLVRQFSSFMPIPIMTFLRYLILSKMMNIRSAALTDIELLAVLNQGKLIERSGEELPSLGELQIIIRNLLIQNHRAFLFETQGSSVGYSLVDFSTSPPTITQFHISRQYRRKGYGRLAFAALLQAVRSHALDIEVCEENREVLSFWRGLGYEPRIAPKHPEE